MKKAILFFVALGACAQTRDVSGPEELTRLVKGSQSYYSSECPENGVKVSLRLKVDKTGQVVQVNDNKASRIAKPAAKVMQSVKQFVLSSWRFIPMLVGGQPVSVSTSAQVQCFAPPPK